MANTIRPSGLTITRSGLKFTLNWKIRDKNYGDGQQFQYAVFTSQQVYKSALNLFQNNSQTIGDTSISATILPSITNKVKWHSVTIGDTTTQKSIQLSASSYYPTSKKPYLAGIIFRVRGNRRAYTEKEKYKDKKGKTKYRDVTVNPGWSAWAVKGFDVKAPGPATVKVEWSEEFINRTTFSWDCGTEGKYAPYTKCIYQTVTALNYNGTVEKIPAWKNATDNSVTSRKSSTYRDEADLADKNLTRAYRIKVVGPGGASAWRYAKHPYGAPQEAVNVTCEATRNEAVGSYHLVISWTAPTSVAQPVTKTTAEYLVAEPGGIVQTESGLVPSVPPDARWEPFPVTKDTAGTNAFSFDLPVTLGDDQCLWVHVVTTHDNHDTPSDAVLAAQGALQPPTITNLETEASTHRAELTIQAGTSVPGAFHAIKYQPADGSNDPDAGKIIGIIPNGSTVAQIQCPEWTNTPAFGVYAVLGEEAESYTRDDGVTIYTLDEVMTSAVASSGGNVPKAPEQVRATQLGTSDTIQVLWDVVWNEATGAEVSWADHEDAWISTEQPQTFEVQNLRESVLNITKLELGKMWYIRVRLYQTNSGGTNIYGPYSDIISVDLSTIPAVPDLQISDEDGIIPATGSTVASWVYVSADGTRQKAATIAEVTEDSGGELEYTRLLSLTTQQQATLSAEALGWETGTQHQIAVQVTSESGNPSHWSAPVMITIAEAISCELTQRGTFATETIDDVEQLALKSLPITLTYTGAGEGGQTNVIIERAESYDLERPDERTYNGFEGAAVAEIQQPGEGQIEITLDDLIGSLDDGAHYRVLASVQDTAGQNADAEPWEFIVHWNKQASIPGGTAEIRDGVAIITPEAPEGANIGDTVDIYRLSSDKPELIVSNGEFGTQYVDPYPTLNEFGGYRLVTVTEYGDYITEGNELAMTDIRTNNDSLFQYIDFDGNQLELKYNADLSTTWTKQFTVTHYLGGSTRGDWLEGTQQEASVNGIILRDIDQDTYQTLRALGDFSGICHVRTTDGSNYTANINVQSGSTYNSPGHPESVALTITRVDNPRRDGMTLAEWETQESE